MYKALRQIAALLGLVMMLAMAGYAQTSDPAAQTAEQALAAWNQTATRAEEVLARGEASSASLETLRAELATQRAAALAMQTVNAERSRTLSAQLVALGPVPAEGILEAPELTARRQELSMQVARVTLPILAANEAYERADGLIGEIDTLMRARLASELVALGPTPLNPADWPAVLGEWRDLLVTLTGEIDRALQNPFRRSYLIEQLPVILLALIAGIVILISVRRVALVRIENSLAGQGKSGRQRILWVALLNLSRLALPALGAWALYFALQTAGILGLNGQILLKAAPEMVAILIGANWLAHSLFSPRLARVRLLDLDDSAAYRGARAVHALGLIWALRVFVDASVSRAQMSSEASATASLILIAIGAVFLWRLSAILGQMLTKVASDEGGDGLGRAFLIQLRRLIVVVALGAPFLAAIGYFAAARFLFYPGIQTLALFAVGFVLSSQFSDLLRDLFDDASPDARSTDQRFLPVVVGFLFACLALPILALIWGARVSDLTEMWVWVNDGVAIGDARFSLKDLLVLIIVFLVGYSVTRLLQKVARTTVLPRTRMDAGGRNALLSGIGYVGYTLAALAAISATGLDLSSLAIVAGALSVGIGFGLQNIVSNFVSGVILLIERPIKEGDWIEVSGFAGYVRGIRVRSTMIETFDRASVIVPNSDLIAGTVLNWTHSNLVGRVRVPVGVAYGSDPRQVEAILLEIGESHPMVLSNPAPAVIFKGFGADSMDFEIRAFLRDVNWMLSAHSDMNFEIVRRFAEAGIEIPFAQRDINFRNLDGLRDALRDAIHPKTPQG